MRETAVDALKHHLAHCQAVFDERFESSRNACGAYDLAQTMLRIGGAQPEDPWILEVQQQQEQAARQLLEARHARETAADALATAGQPSLWDRQLAKVRAEAPELPARLDQARASLASAMAADDERAITRWQQMVSQLGYEITCFGRRVSI
jgi:hypothetical protein